MVTNVVQSFTGSFSILMLRVAGYTEGVAKYPNCANQFSVNFTASPAADISDVASGDMFLYSIINLERCTIYDTFARSYRGGQLLGTTYAAVSVMISKQCW